MSANRRDDGLTYETYTRYALTDEGCADRGNGREGWGDDPNFGVSATPTELITSRPTKTRPIFRPPFNANKSDQFSFPPCAPIF